MQETDRDIQYVSLGVDPPVVVMDDGELLGVISWLDDDDEAVETPEEATKVLAGPCKLGDVYITHLETERSVFN